MKLPLLLLCATLFLRLSLCLRAADGGDENSGETTASPHSGEAPALPPVAQDPFWPVGYVPSNPTPPRVITPAGVIHEPNALDLIPPVPNEPQWEVVRKQLKIQGISRVGVDKKTGRPTYFAVINGRVVEEGSIIETITPDFIYRWKVAAIAEKNVKLNPLEARNR
jgi:hypothetical protein